MENESQKIYRTIMDVYARISKHRRFGMTPRTHVSFYKRGELASELSKIYYVHFVHPENLSNINAFAEQVKRQEMSIRMPQIEEKVRSILWQFFHDKEWKQDEIIFENMPQPLHEMCMDILKAEVGRNFFKESYIEQTSALPCYFKKAAESRFFERPFTLKELVEWIYLHED